MTGPSASPQTPSPTATAGPSTSPSISSAPGPLPVSPSRSASRAAPGSPAGSPPLNPASGGDQAAAALPEGTSTHSQQSMSINKPIAGDPAAWDSTDLEQSAAINDPQAVRPSNMGAVSSTPVALIATRRSYIIPSYWWHCCSSGVVTEGISLAAPGTASASRAALPFIGGQQIRFASDGAVVLGTSILSPGAQITLLGTILSIDTKEVIIGSKTYSCPFTSTVTTSPPIDGQQFQRAPNGGIFLPGGSTIQAGGPAATMAGTMVSALPSGAGLLINSSTVVLFPTETASQPVFTSAGQVLTADPSRFSTGSMTLLGNNGGPAAVLSGTIVSLATPEPQIGSSTVSLAPSDTGLGQLILLGMGVRAPSGMTVTASSSTASVLAFTGTATRITADGWWVMGLVLGLNTLLAL